MSQKSEIDRIFTLQKKQQWTNKASSATERIQKLNQLKLAIQKREAHIKDALYADLAKPELGADSELNSVYEEIDFAIANLSDWMQPVSVPASPQFQGCDAKVTYEALGIVLLFGPWNFPFSLVFQPLVSIIAAGNTALVKPNEMAAETSKVSADIINDIFDENDVAVFEGGVDLANDLLAMPVNHVFFTGSPAVGRIVMAAAAKHLASVTLELGGKNPVIIDRSADLQDAATKLAFMRNFNNGQVCLCPENIWVPEEMEADFLAVAKATVEAVFYVDGKYNPDSSGKIIDERNFNRVNSYVEDAVAKGAEVAYQGEHDLEKRAFHPTIMTKVPSDAKIQQEETFGPILSVFTYKDVSEAIETIQQQPKPLAIYLFAQDDDFVERALTETSSGGVTVNHCVMHAAEINLPFGGVNNSGIGRYHGVHGFKELSHERAVLSLPAGGGLVG